MELAAYKQLGVLGEAGEALSTDEARRRFGKKNVLTGQWGERELVSMIREARLDQQFCFWTSRAVPNDPNDYRAMRSYGDVDLVAANGNRVVLIDAKWWSGGKVYWSFGGRPMNGLSPVRDSGGRNWKPLSRNMAMAVERFSAVLPGHYVSAIVIFVKPRSSKGSLPASVKLLRWPGGIRSYLPGDGVRQIRKRLGDPVGGTTELVAGICGSNPRTRKRAD